MKAIKFDNPGGSDVLYIAEIDIPEPADDQILLKNHAIGINRPDILQRKGPIHRLQMHLLFLV